MKDVKLYILIIGILVAGIAFNSVAQSSEKRAEKKYYQRIHHEPKNVKTDFKNKKAARSDTKAAKHARQFGKQKHKGQKYKAYARRKDD
jgi:hypothetical protein